MLWTLLFAWPVLAVLGLVIDRWLTRPAVTGLLMAVWLVSLPKLISELIVETEVSDDSDALPTV